MRGEKESGKKMRGMYHILSLIIGKKHKEKKNQKN
jgi:hypothetical protein